jgi:hypothetical protein
MRRLALGQLKDIVADDLCGIYFIPMVIRPESASLQRDLQRLRASQNSASAVLGRASANEHWA